MSPDSTAAKVVGAVASAMRSVTGEIYIHVAEYLKRVDRDHRL
jgi:hypothetical protein